MHEKAHTGPKPHTCEVFDKPFGRLDTLQKHKRNVHKVKVKPTSLTVKNKSNSCKEYFIPVGNGSLCNV